MASVGNFDFRARRRGHKGQPRPMGGYDYESSSFPTSPAAPQDYDGGHFSWPPPGLSPYASGYDSYDHDRYERERYEHDRYERERYEQERYERDRYEHDRYDYDHRYEHHRYEQHGRSGHGPRYEHEERWHGGERYEHERNYNRKLPDYIDPRIPSTHHPDPDYLAYLDSLYTPLEGMPQAPVMHSDFDDWRDWRADDWSANPGLFDTLDDAHDVLPSAEISKEDHPRPKYFGDAPGSSCSTSDTDGQVLKLPTKGSAKHNLGTCKPCAFVYKNGCASGYDCEFCHLCKPGEKKRRKKERKQQMRHIR